MIFLISWAYGLEMAAKGVFSHMIKLVRRFAVLALLCNGAAQAENPPIPELHLFGEGLPPFAYLEDGRLKGISVEILAEMLIRAGSSQTVDDVTLVAWARGYAQAQALKNTLLFSTTRSAARESLFHWVGPIISARVVAIANRNLLKRPMAPQDLSQYRIGVSRNSVGHEMLLRQGVAPSSFIPIVAESRGARLLARGRIDLWVAEETMALWEMRKLGIDPTRYRVVHRLTENDLYFAFNLETDDEVIEKFQAAIDAMSLDGTQADIIRRYLPDTDTFAP